jgi:hypothetical protein
LVSDRPDTQPVSSNRRSTGRRRRRAGEPPGGRQRARWRSGTGSLGRLRQVAFTFERADSDANEQGLLLDTDDDVPAGAYTQDALRLLADVAAVLEDGGRLANDAFSALSHLKPTDPEPPSSER